MPPDREKTIAPDDALRAVYLDFEGLQDESPALVGYACEYSLTQVVLDPQLRPAARAKSLPTGDLSDTLAELLDRCEEEDRLLVAFSQAEKNIVREYTEHELEPYYRDGRLIAKRWINRVHYDADVDWRLKSLTSWIGFSWPRHLGDGKATKKIRYVRDMLERKGEYERLTGTAKRHWTNLLTYNKLDCMSLRDLVLRAASELDLAVEHRISG